MTNPGQRGVNCLNGAKMLDYIREGLRCAILVLIVWIVVHVQAASSLSIVFGEKINKTKVCILLSIDVIGV